MKIRDEDGFTFIEVIIVLAIILILSGSVGLIAFRYIGQANVASAKSQIQVYSMALTSYALDNNTYPSQEQGLQALYTRPSGNPTPKNWQGPYVEKAIKNDPWGNPYKYVVPGPNGLSFGISSLGSDGLVGGTGDKTDINSWE